jgi:hypothetical protein
MSARRQRHLERLRDERRKLSPDEVQRVIQMKERGLTYSAIAAWFTRNGKPITYRAVRNAYARERV